MLEEKVSKTIAQYNLIKTGDCITLGVSGGPDSTCLFHLFLKLQQKMNFSFVVAHINHQIRKEAKQDQEYVENLCKKYEIECFVKTLQVIEKAKQEKMGTEEAGREARYEFFEEISEKVGANKIATAHNKNDQVETVLMNLMRGTGLSRAKRNPSN